MCFILKKIQVKSWAFLSQKIGAEPCNKSIRFDICRLKDKKILITVLYNVILKYFLIIFRVIIVYKQTILKTNF